MNPWVWSPPPTLCPHLIPVGRPQGLACLQPLFAGCSSGDLFLHGWSSDSVFKHFPNKVPQAVGFYNRNSSSPRYTGWMSKVKVLAGFVSAEACLPGLQTATFCLCVRRRTDLWCVLLLQGHNPIGLGPHPYELI